MFTYLQQQRQTAVRAGGAGNSDANSNQGFTLNAQGGKERPQVAVHSRAELAQAPGLTFFLPSLRTQMTSDMRLAYVPASSLWHHGQCLGRVWCIVSTSEAPLRDGEHCARQLACGSPSLLLSQRQPDLGIHLVGASIPCTPQFILCQT